MKRYILLLAGTLLTVAAVLITAAQFREVPAAVKTAVLKEETVERTVLCAGIIESADTRLIRTELPCVAGDIRVKEGDTVKEGDLLFTVNQAATAEVLAANGFPAGYTGAVPDEYRAPVTGVVVSMAIAAQLKSDGSIPCAAIASTEQLQVRILIHEKNLKQVKAGQTVLISGSAFAKEKYRGVLAKISPIAKQNAAAGVSETVVEGFVLLDRGETDSSLRLGLSAKANIVVEEHKAVLTVPYEAVEQDEADNKPFVYLYYKGRAFKREIETGMELTSGIQITGGLLAGDEVIVNPRDVRRHAALVDKQMA